MRRTRNRGIGIAVVVALARLIGGALGGVTNGGAATSAAPVNQNAPTISGKTEVGATLTANNGTWSNNPTDFDYQWRRCDQAGGSCGNIGGATSREYLLKNVDRDNTIRVRVTARNADGSNTATSAQTAVVTNPASTTGCARTGTIPVVRAVASRAAADRPAGHLAAGRRRLDADGQRPVPRVGV